MGLALAGALALTFWTIPTTFDLNVRTERLWFVPSPDHVSRWYLQKVTLFEDLDENGRDFTGSVRFHPGVDVRFERLALGPLRIRGQAPGTGAPVATLYDPSDEPVGTARDRLVVVVDGVRARAEDGRPLALPITGKLEFGRRIGADSGLRPSLLRDGTITLLGHAVVGGTRFVSGTVALAPGDHVSVEASSDFAGVVAVHEGAVLTVAVRAVGRRATVSRFGAEGYEVRTSLGSRILNDPLVTASWTGFFSLLGWVVYLRPAKAR
jgi:hypothetical protein